MLAVVVREFSAAARSLARTPWFTLTAVLMLAAGLGLSLYMFGAINGFVLRPMPFLDAERLTFVAYADPEDADDEFGVPLHDYIEIRAAQTHFEDLAGFYEGTINLSDGQRPERYDGVFTTEALFSELGMRAALGRTLEAADTRPGAPQVAVISHALWLNRFGAQPDVIGRGVRINGRDATVVGVMPPSFRFPRTHDVWVPLPLDTSTPRADAISLEVFGRLRRGADLDQARQELDALLTRINAAHPENRRSDRGLMRPYAHELISAQTRSILLTMFAAVLLVLLIACANVANLMVARGAAQTRETAIRGALGAGRGRLVARVLAECLLIAAAAALVGLAGAVVGGEITVQAIHASEDPPVYWADFDLDARGAAFAFAVVLLAAGAAGLLPALHAAATPAAQAMRAGSAGAIGRGSRIGRVLVVLEVAVCMALLVGAGLTVRSVLEMQRFDLGVDVDNVLTGRVGLFPGAYPGAEEQRSFVANLERRLAALPGVENAALSTSLPTMDMGLTGYLVEGREPPPDNAFPGAWTSSVTPSYFDTFRFTRVEGRLLGEQDHAEAPPVVLVNRSFATRNWPEGSALGRRIRLSPNSPDARWATVVGVVPDTVQGDLTFARRDAVFRPMAQAPAAFLSFAVRTRGEPYAIADAVRAAVQAEDADLPIYWLRSMREWVDIATWDSRLLAKLFGVFAGFALLLAVSGIYAVLAYSVSQRVREIGVRRALGAQDRGILRMVMGQGGRQLGLGLALGFLLALGFGRMLAGVLFGVESFDPSTFAIVAVTLLLVSVLAGLVPARRALRVEPMTALRHD